MKEDLEQPIETDIDYDGAPEDPWEKWAGSVWSVKGYNAGILTEDASTPIIEISERAQKAKKIMDEAVARRYELLAAQESAALEMAMEGYDQAIIFQARSLKEKYDALNKNYITIESEYYELHHKVSDLRKKRNSLKHQKKVLDKTVKSLESDVMERMDKAVDKMLKDATRYEKMEKQIAKKAVEAQTAIEAQHETISNLEI